MAAPPPPPSEKRSGAAGLIGAGILLAVLGVTGWFFFLPVFAGNILGGVIGGTPSASSGSFIVVLCLLVISVLCGAGMFLAGVMSWLVSLSGRAGDPRDRAPAQPVSQPSLPRPPVEFAVDGGNCPDPPMNTQPD
jgi:hypothetical protein